MAEQMSLDNILSDEKPAPPSPREPVIEAPAKEPAAEAPASEPKEPVVDRPQSRRKAWADKEQDAQGRVRDPATGQFVAKAEAETAAPAEPKKEALPAEPAKPVAAPAQEMTEKEKAFLRGMTEERSKRQELERRLAALEAGKTQPGAPTEPPKTFWEDADGALAKHKQEIEQSNLSTRLRTAELIARYRHPDFEEKLNTFQELVSKTPGLWQQCLAAADPAEYAYGLAKNHQELQQVGNLDALKAKIQKETESRVRAQVEAEFKAKAEAAAKERAALPGSLSDARSVGVNRPVWGGPTAMEDILKG